jgi:hypothetical protein
MKQRIQLRIVLPNEQIFRTMGHLPINRVKLTPIEIEYLKEKQRRWEKNHGKFWNYPIGK